MKKAVSKKEKLEYIDPAPVIEYKKEKSVKVSHGEEDFFENPCRGCGHAGNMHFEGKHRQCNTSECSCAKYTI